MMMTEAKVKRKHDGEAAAVPESQNKKARDQVTDEEVEEFYGILRRINKAVKYFKSNGDDVAALEKEIMLQVKEAADEKEDKILTLDLNVPPQSRHE